MEILLKMRNPSSFLGNLMGYYFHLYQQLYQIGLNRIYFIVKNAGGDSESVYAEIGWAGTEDHEFEEDVPVAWICLSY